MQIDVSQMTAGESVTGDDSEDTQLLREMHTRASAFLADFSWCSEIRQSFFGCGIGGVVAVFLMEIAPTREDVDEWLWVIVGDLPPAYLVTEDTRNATDALEIYVELMRDWIRAVRGGLDLNQFIPVNSPPTSEVANQLETRLNTLEQLGLCGINGRAD
jgi:hypothetical protein